MKVERAGPRIAYVMSRFPKLTETFILYEMIELERLGVAVEIFPLMREPEKVVHPEAAGMMPRVRFMPFLSAPVAAANLRALRRQPGRYLGILAEVLWGTRGSRRFLTGTLALFPKIVCMAEQMQALGISHIHAHFANHPAMAAFIIHRLTGIEYSFTAHGSDIHVDQTMFDRKLAAAAFATTVCRYNVDFLAERFGDGLRGRLTVLHCGTDVEAFAPSRRTEAETGTRPFRILCVAGLFEVKGHRYLVEACRLLRQRGVAFECRMIGDGPLRNQVAEHIRAAGLEGDVLLLGPRPRGEVREAMLDADVCVLPSVLTRRGDREGIPVALMEAMASGRPVVSSRQAGIPELVEDGVEGLLCRPGDAVALADALERLAGDPELRRRLGAAGRRKVVREFDLRRNAARLAELLLSALPGRTVRVAEEV